MRLAVPVFNGYVAPRVDCTATMEILDVSEDKVTGREKVFIPPIHPFQLPDFLKSRNVNTLICGGIPYPLLQLLQQYGIKVIYGVIGEVDEVIDTFLNGKLRVNLNFGFERRCGRRRRFRGGGKGFKPGRRNI